MLVVTGGLVPPVIFNAGRVLDMVEEYTDILLLEPVVLVLRMVRVGATVDLAGKPRPANAVEALWNSGTADASRTPMKHKHNGINAGIMVHSA